jgi:hypothetical protein
VAFSIGLAGCGSSGTTEATGGASGTAGKSGSGGAVKMDAGTGGVVATGGVALGGAVGLDAGATGGTVATGGVSGGIDAGPTADLAAVGGARDTGPADIAPAVGGSGGGGTGGTGGSLVPDGGPGVGPEAGSDVSVMKADAPADGPVGDAPVDAAKPDGGSGGACLEAKWDKLIKASSPGGVANLQGLAADKDGNLFLALSFWVGGLDLGSGALTSAGGADVAIAKINPSTGLAVWAKAFGDDSDQAPARLAVAKSGQVGMIGTFGGKMTVGNAITNGGADPIDFVAAVDGSGTGLWAKGIDTANGALNAIASNPAQDAFAVCGYTMGAATDLVPGATASSDGKEDIVVAKFNATTGAILWSRQIGGAGSQYCTALAMDASGNVFAAGTYNGTLDLGLGAFSPAPASTALAIWAAKLDTANGSATLAKSWGGAGKQSLGSIALDSAAGNLAIAGSLTGTVPFGSFTLTTAVSATDAGAAVAKNTDVFVVKLDTSLNPLWAHNWGDTANQEANTVVFDSKGDLIVAGSLAGTIDLGSAGTLTAATGVNFLNNSLPDVFWMKLQGSSGTALCGARYGDDNGQKVREMVIGPTASGVQTDVVTLAGSFQGSIDFGLPADPLLAGVAGTPTSVLVYPYLVQFAP